MFPLFPVQICHLEVPGGGGDGAHLLGKQHRWGEDYPHGGVRGHGHQGSGIHDGHNLSHESAQDLVCEAGVFSVKQHGIQDAPGDADKPLPCTPHM